MKFLPHSQKAQKGFTLVELLVVITIIVILATIGLQMYSQVQVRARDAKRIADINALSSAMETHYNTSAGSGGCGAGLLGVYCGMKTSYFQDGVIPTDPRNGTTSCQDGGGNATASCKYCVRSSASTCASGDDQVGADKPADGVETYTICANMEGDNAAPGGNDYYCKSNQQ